MSSTRCLALTIAAVASLGCSSPFGTDERLALDVARERWDARPFQDYVFDGRHDCFCTPEAVGPVRITVRQGAIETVTLLETGEAVDPAIWFTIEELFQLIPQFAEGDGVDDVDAEYDQSLGYPSSVVVRYEEGITDAGSHYTLSAVGPAP